MPCRHSRLTAVLLVPLLVLPAGVACAQPPPWAPRITVGPPAYPPHGDWGLSGYGGAYGLSPGYGWWPDYSYNWPSLSEALATYGLFGRRMRCGGPGASPPPGPAAPGLPPAEDATPAGAAVLRLHVPAGALVRFNGQATARRGEWLQFVTPPLPADRHLPLDVEASWQEQGRLVRHSRGVRLHAGDRVTVDFLKLDAAAEEGGLLPQPRKLGRP